MLKSGILNPAINSLISRVRHTNLLVIADRGFPFWPSIETIDLSLVDDIPRVLDVLKAIRANFQAGKVFMAEEFKLQNDEQTQRAFEAALDGISIHYEPHVALKTLIPNAIGLIRTADTIQYSNMVLESA